MAPPRVPASPARRHGAARSTAPCVIASPCSSSPSARASPAAPARTTNERGLDRRNFDPGVAACANFYLHGNGGWIKSNPIPPEYSTWSIGNEMRERNLQLLRQILEEAAQQDAAPGSNARKIGDFYASGMDEAAIEKAGYDPIKADLAAIDALQDNAAVAALLMQWHAQGIQPLFGFGALGDLKNSRMAIGYATQGGLGLPERDYYLKDDAESAALRARYRAHVQRLLELVGDPGEPTARSRPAGSSHCETRLAKASLDKVAMRDPGNYYNIQTVAAAKAHTPHFDWRAYFDALGLDGLQTLLARAARLLQRGRPAAGRLPTAHWQAYLRWHLVDAAAPYLSNAFVEQDFAFNGRTLTGAKELRPRWKRVHGRHRAASSARPLGELYVARSLPARGQGQGPRAGAGPAGGAEGRASRSSTG